MNLTLPMQTADDGKMMMRHATHRLSVILISQPCSDGKCARSMSFDQRRFTMDGVLRGAEPRNDKLGVQE